MSRTRRVAPSAPPVAATEPRPRGAAIAAALSALVAAALHAPTLGYEFVWDDARLIVTNAGLRSWEGLRQALLADFWITSGPAASGFWRPLVTFSYAVDRAWGGGAPWAFHAVNVAAHAAVSALVVVLASRLGAGPLAAFGAGLAFAVMPVHVESVAWIAGRTDVLCALFALLAIVLDRRARDRGARWPGVAALAAGLAALLAKEAAALLPLFVLAFEWSGPPRGRPSAWRWSVPWWVLVAVWGAVHVVVVPPAPAPAYLDPSTLARGRLASLVAYPAYLAFLWPFTTHTPATLLPAPGHAFDVRVLAGATLHVLTLAALVAAVRRRSAWVAPLVLFWGGLGPTLGANLLQAYLLHSERFLYLPSVGVAWALALALETSRGAFARGSVRVAVAAFVLSSAIVTWRTLPDWRSDEALFVSMTEKGPRNAQGWTQLTRLRMGQGRESEALEALARAEALAAGRPEVRSLRGLVAYRRGDWRSVLAHADTALAIDPTLPEPRLARATALLRMGRLDEAGEELTVLDRRMPDNATVAGLKGQWLARVGREAEALPLLQRAAAEESQDADVHFALGMVRARVGDLAGARAAFARAVEEDPQFAEAWMRLAVAAHQLGDVPARDAALARAASLPEAGDGRVERLRAQLERPSAPPGALNR